MGRTHAAQLGTLTAAILPGLAVVGLGFRAGGYFAGSTALAAVLGLLAVVVVIQIIPRPFAGVGSAALIPVGGMALLAAWSLASASWSGATARAIIDSDRYLLYAVLTLLGAGAVRTAARLHLAAISAAAGMVFVVGAGVLTRLLPKVLSVAPSRNPDRMSFPLTYWNALGLLAAAGIVLCVGLAASERAHRATRALAAAAVPMLAVGLYLTLSRGAILVLAVGLVVFAVLARSRRLLTTTLAIVPPTALAVVVAYGRRGLTSDHPAGRLGVNGGRYLLFVLIACMVSALLLHLGLRGGEERLVRWRPRRRAGRRTLGLGAAALAAVVVVVALAAGAPHDARHLVTRFADSSSVPTGRSRLTDVRNAGRIEHWRVALHTFADHPLDGTGAGTYATQWAQHRRTTLSVQHAHSAYFGVLSDLGLPGGILLVGSILALLVGLARRARGPDAALAAAAFAAALMWALHAGIDWDLEMPATGAWVFILGGGALARSAVAAGARRRPLGGTVRLATGVAVLVVAVTPGLIAVSQARIGASVRAFEHRDCRAAIANAISANNALGLRPEPYEILGFCDAQLGAGPLAVTMMQRAVDRDPDWWEYRYGLALVKGAAGQDPRPAIAEARRLNPRNDLARNFAQAVRHATTPAQWRKAALAADLPDT